jgi:crotonobetaine/carnitine-CoA ligase
MAPAPDPWVRDEQRTIGDLLDRRLDSDPDGPFLEVCGTRWTAAEVDAATNRVAHGLTRLGVQPGDRVASLLENSPEALLTWWGAIKAGAVAVPVNTAHKGVFLEHQISDAAPRVLVVQDDLSERVDAGITGIDGLDHVVTVCERARRSGDATWHRWADLASGDDARPGVRARPADLATLVYTGGTTGPSKGCAISQNYHVRMAEQNMVAWGRTAADVVWTPLPLFHYNAIQMAVVGTLVVGGSAVIERRFSVSGFWPQINAAGATMASLLGSLAVMIARDRDRPEQPRSGHPEANTTLRQVTGAPMPPEIDAIFRQRFGVATWSYAYGTTEACLLSWLPPGVPPKAGSAGVVNSDDFDVRIFDDGDVEVPPDTPGEIVCRPRKPNVMFSGYWRRPEATLAASSNWWLHTGDIGRIEADGYLFFLDRKADYIRRRGENISSWELEQTFHRHELVEDVAVSAVPSSVSEDDVKVTVVVRAGARLTEEELCRWSVERLPYFAVPRYIEFRPDLPRSETGRITKAALRSDGVTDATWDREAAGLTFERR